MTAGARKIIKAAKLLEGNFQAINLARREGVKSVVVGNRIRQIADQVSRREEYFKGSATEKLGELLPAMTSRKALMMRESERELPNSGLIFIPIIIAVIARTAAKERGRVRNLKGIGVRKIACRCLFSPPPPPSRCFVWVILQEA